MVLTSIFYLRLLFLLLFFKELYITKFKHKKYKFIWFFLVLVFGYYGYSIYIANRRGLIPKRKFNPDFSKCKYRIDTEI